MPNVYEKSSCEVVGETTPPVLIRIPTLKLKYIPPKTKRIDAKMMGRLEKRISGLKYDVVLGIYGYLFVQFKQGVTIPSQPLKPLG